MKNNTFEEIWEKIEQSQKVLMSLHPKPDGDSLGSCSAMKYVLEKMGKEVTIVSKDKLSEGLEGFSFVKEIKMGENLEDLDFKEFDILILLDHGTIYGYSENIEEKLKEIFVINIDHHENNFYKGNLNYVDPNAASACSVLLKMFKEKSVKFNGDLSNMLLLGISTDTGFFSHGNSDKSFKDVAFLIEKGGNYHKKIFVPVAKNVSFKVKKLHGILLDNLEIKEIESIKVAHSFIEKKDVDKLNLEPADARLGIIVLQDIGEADIVFSLSETEEGVKGSFRSVDIDVSLFAQELGGGGHKPAAAFMLKDVSIEKAREKVFDAIKKVGIHKIE